VQLTNNVVKSYQLKIPSGSINGIAQQCLIYYYYVSTSGQQSITIRKVEIDDTNEMIDFVTSSPFNGWIRRAVTFNATKRGYKVDKVLSSVHLTRIMLYCFSALFRFTKNIKRDISTKYCTR
jgi:hypothetical protein